MLSDKGAVSLIALSAVFVLLVLVAPDVLLIVFFPLIRKFLPKPTPPAAPAPEREKIDA